MTAVIANLRVSGLRNLISTSKKLQAVANDFRPDRDDLLQLLSSDVGMRFAQAPPTQVGGQVLGGRNWPAVTEGYLGSNPRRVGGRLLLDTGELAQSFQVGASGNIAEVGQSNLRFGSNLPKARGLAEKRPLIFMHPKLRREMENVIRKNWEATA